MSEIVVEELRGRRENDIEHEVAFRWGGRRLVARVLLLDASGREAWAPGTRHDVEIRLVRGWKVVKTVSNMRPALDDEGHAIWRAIGPVLAVDGDVVTVDVGFPLEVDLDRIPGQPELTVAVGDSLAVRGELRVADREV